MMMQITDLQKEQQIPPLFRLGFRPFFLFGASFAIIAIILWGLILHGNIAFQPYGSASWWHKHEMIFGFGSAIIAGFLLTAVQNWTGTRGVSGIRLGVLFALWLLARISLFWPSLLGETASMIIDLLFLPCVAYFLAKPIIAIKQYRNLFFIPLLLLFTLINIEFHLTVIDPEQVSIQSTSFAAVLLITTLMSVMAGRVTPMFTANGTQTPKVMPIMMVEYACNGLVALAMFTQLFAPVYKLNPYFMAAILLLAGMAHATRWFRWRPWITFGVPLLWSLHLAMFFVWFSLMLLAFAWVNTDIPMIEAWHLLTIGGMSGLILAMISRVSLGHTGRPLMPPKTMSLAFSLIFLSAILRSFGPWFTPEHSLFWIDLSITCWVISFGLFVYHYAPMLLAPRADNRPG
jgi:uncharacterized protein involved in response to NO